MKPDTLPWVYKDLGGKFGMKSLNSHGEIRDARGVVVVGDIHNAAAARIVRLSEYAYMMQHATPFVLKDDTHE